MNLVEREHDELANSAFKKQAVHHRQYHPDDYYKQEKNVEPIKERIDLTEKEFVDGELANSSKFKKAAVHQREYQPEDVNDLIIQYYKQEVPDKQSIRISDKDYADGKEMDTSKFRQSAIHQRQYKPEDVRTLFNSVFQRTSQTNSELG